ncbi:hypothetical protein HF984_07815 [Rothia terrae]|uniref:hypothetical protein n=1 Tax=Rothia terrae TaxID=396015 RepID=UPI001445403F|nr:hypothetical protein [Rothia terrae]NKZ34661.1 hypothetical protein [Rothia terrae]
MTATTSVTPRTSTYANHKLSFWGVLRSEALKFRTLTTNWVMTLVIGAVLVLLALAVGAAINQLYSYTTDPQLAADAAERGAMPQSVEGIVDMTYGLGGSGMQLACMLIASVAVVFIASEYATHQINTTLTAVPKRSMVYLAKLIIVSIYAFVIGFVFAAISYFVGLMLVNDNIANQVDFNSGVVMNWLGVAIFSMLMAWMGLGFGALLRNNAGGIVLVVVLMFVISLVFMMFPWEWATDFAKYLPMAMGETIIGYGLPDDAEIGYVQAGGILALWSAIPALLGYLRFRFTDPK